MTSKAIGRVLIIGDEGDLSSSLKELLSPLGYETVVSYPVETVFSTLAQADFDLVILDGASSHRGEGGVIPRMRELAPQIGIAVITDCECCEAEAEVLLQSADYCLERPIDPAHLQDVLIRAQERCRLFGSLDAERSRYKRLSASIPIGIFEIDLESNTLSYVNRYLLDLSGYDEDDVIGRPPEEFVAAEDKERLLTRLSARVKGGMDISEPIAIYTFCKRGGGTFKAQVSTRLAETESGRLIEGVLHDVTVEQRLTRLHRAVLSLGETILAEGDIDRILQLVLDAITEHGGFRRAVLSLYDLSIADPHLGEVHKILASGLSEQELATLRSQGGMTPQEREMAFAERFKLGQAYYIPHDQVPWDPELGLRGTAVVDGWHPDDFLFFPLKGEGGIIGHISVDDPLDRTAPTTASIAPVATLVNFAALAVERIYRLKQLHKRKGRLHGLSKFSRQLDCAQTVESLCMLAAERLRQDMNYELCAIWLKDGSELVLAGITAQESINSEEIPKRKTRIPIAGNGLARWVIEHQKPIIVPDVRKDRRYKEWITATRSEVDVPILGRKGALGSISVESRKVAAFNEQDLEILTAMASQLSVAISNLNRRESLSQIYTFGKKLTEAETIDHLIESTLAFLADQFNLEQSAFLLCEGEELVVRGVRSPSYEETLSVGDRFRSGEGIVGWVADNGRYALINDVENDPRYVEGFVGTRSELAVPLTISGRVLGVLNIESPQTGFFDEEDRRLLEAVADETVIALSNLVAQEQLRQQAVRDPLTQLYNRHYFNEVIRFELERADRYNRPLSLMMLDVDGFRAVNNRLGHLKGDEVLHAVAQIIGRSVRAADRVIRYGGDEFLILMPETDGPPAQVLQRLKEQIARLSHDLDLEGLSIGLSIGYCTRRPHDDRPLEEILEEADRRMYADKRATHADRSDDYQY